MGYYTRYELEVIGIDSSSAAKTTKAVAEQIIHLCEGYTPFVEECKWYEHDEHMIEVSKNFPEHILMLYGEGEEAGDIWKTYYYNGKKQQCPAKITYDDFDPKKLK